YENKYVKFFRSKPELPPGLSPDTAPSRPTAPPQGSEQGLSKAAKRNLKRKEKRKQQQEKATEQQQQEKATEQQQEKATDGAGGTPVPTEEGGQGDNAGGSSERSRRIKSLRKKLRQVEELQQRLESGGLPQPTKEQLEKLGRRKALEEELRGLEV
ncbi:PYM1 protein, partial [Grallaria varia]|nr:PYM1 protein [Grallaria varia]